MHTPTHNPFGATRLDQVLCVEARRYRTLKDGDFFVYLAMDAVSWHAHHFTVRRSDTVADHIAFIREALAKYRLPQGSTLAVSLPATAEEELVAAFPLFSRVICDAAGVAEVTREFHDGFAAQMGARPA
ncbi:MAG TPA: hypothetical protein PKD45_12440 [Flavobacteriales bacterium]|nr:hypothetical protein [Flavobacteriales bacterium]